MSVTKSTRKESYESLDKENLYRNIVDVLTGNARLTAREISVVLYSRGLVEYPVRQAVAPRLTELVNMGVIKVDGKIYDYKTQRNVAAYRLVAE